ncbi:MAG: CPBP family intramembrane metalloprotease [Ruminococcus flavefaciens]|nr:CPBP family intramembrane metalloprotease [Ruminococcus flavefaciens]MCM1228663.1 CPBP family intramembrane metalloprotease [Ruminococcus flavefaciens]
MENENIYPQQYRQPPNYQPPLSEEKQFRNKLSFASGGLLIYSAIMYIISFGVMFVYIFARAFMAGIKSEQIDTDQILSDLMETDMGMSLGVILGCIFLLLYNIKRIKPKQVFAKRKPMSVSKFIMLVCVLMCIQLPISLFDMAFEAILNLFGLSAQMAIETSQAGSTTISMMLYAGFIAPFAEEFVYRGYTMKSLENMGAGKGYALLISSLLFGIMHANPTQSVYAVLAGMVFGYTAMEYGIIWSMLLHFANNFIFGDVMVFICNRVPETVGEIISWGMLIGLFIAGVVVLIVKRKQAIAYIKENYKTEGKYYGWTFTNIIFWVFVGINLILALLAIQKLEQ